MEFPQQERLIYDQNPLIEVVAEIRFSQIFEIDAELPVQFQKKVRGLYPFVEKEEVFYELH